MVYPAPLAKNNTASQAPDTNDDPDAHLFAGAPPQAVDLARRLQEASSTSEFNGIQHIFVSALGALAYADVDVDDSVWGVAARPPGEHPPTKRECAREAWLNDIRTIQCELPCNADCSSHPSLSAGPARGRRGGTRRGQRVRDL